MFSFCFFFFFLSLFITTYLKTHLKLCHSKCPIFEICTNECFLSSSRMFCNSWSKWDSDKWLIVLAVTRHSEISKSTLFPDWISQTWLYTEWSSQNFGISRTFESLFVRIISQFNFVFSESGTIYAPNLSFWFRFSFWFLFSRQLNIWYHLINRKRTHPTCSLQRYKNILKSQTETMKSQWLGVLLTKGRISMWAELD
jgi:hypothetical protein